MAHLAEGDFPLPQVQVDSLTAGQLTALVREAIYADPNLPRAKPRQASHLAALISVKAPGANALLAVPQADASGPHEVGLRFANVPLVSMAVLHAMQERGALTAREANTEVWTRVSETVHSAH